MAPRSTSIDLEDNSSVPDLSHASSNETDVREGSGYLCYNSSKKRTVTFAATAKVRQFTKMTKEQAKDIWFSNDDFTKMKVSFAPTVQRMMNSGSSLSRHDEVHCTRGLEYRTKDGARRRMRNKHNGMAAVLHEQDRQSFEDRRDPERLAKAYKDVNYACVLEAIALGRQDEADIQDYLADMDNNNESSCSSEGDEEEASSPVRAVASLVSKRVTKIKHSGSFHEKGIRGLKRIFSGPKKLRRNSQAGAVAVA